MYTIAHNFQYYSKCLPHVENPQNECITLLADILKKNKTWIILNTDYVLSIQNQIEFEKIIEYRKNSMPITKILKYKNFFNNRFAVDTNVLDPRNESEVLIETVIEKFPNKNQPLNILELGVGSGCIILSLIDYYKKSKGIGVEISTSAIQMAYQNACNLRLANRLILFCTHWKNLSKLYRNADIIITNPPYVASYDIENLENSVKLYDPLVSLNGGVMYGAELYQEIFAVSRSVINKPEVDKSANHPRSRLLCECGYNNSNIIKRIAIHNNYQLESEHNDINGITRVLCFCPI